MLSLALCRSSRSAVSLSALPSGLRDHVRGEDLAELHADQRRGQLDPAVRERAAVAGGHAEAGDHAAPEVGRRLEVERLADVEHGRGQRVDRDRAGHLAGERGGHVRGQLGAVRRDQRAGVVHGGRLGEVDQRLRRALRRGQRADVDAAAANPRRSWCSRRPPGRARPRARRPCRGVHTARRPACCRMVSPHPAPLVRRRRASDREVSQLSEPRGTGSTCRLGYELTYPRSAPRPAARRSAPAARRHRAWCRTRPARRCPRRARGCGAGTGRSGASVWASENGVPAASPAASQSAGVTSRDTSIDAPRPVSPRASSTRTSSSR